MSTPKPPPRGGYSVSKEENIYIPAFISKRPFYVTAENQSDYLDHQRLHKKDEPETWYDRGRTAGPAATKFRRGACDNCGAITHKAPQCPDRPRAREARKTASDIGADVLLDDLDVGWDAKRDRWNGYDAREYEAVTERYQKMHAFREQTRAPRQGTGDDEDDGDDGEEAAPDRFGADDKYAETSDMSKHQSKATMQLRLREDTARYLLNLDLDSARYDPKRRKLVDGGAMADDATHKLVAEENFNRSGGDAASFEQAQRLAWEVQETLGSTDTHLQANPTAGLLLRRRVLDEKPKQLAERNRALGDRYGDGDADPPPLGVAVAGSERFVEYDEYGLIKGAPAHKARSSYAEDVFINNHTSVWGSWWHDFAWGYACCHSFVRGSYCMGESGKRALEAAERQRRGELVGGKGKGLVGKREVVAGGREGPVGGEERAGVMDDESAGLVDGSAGSVDGRDMVDGKNMVNDMVNDGKGKV